MIGLRRVLIHPGWCFCLLASCASTPESELTIAGTHHGSDRDAQILYVQAQAAEQESNQPLREYRNQESSFAGCPRRTLPPGTTP